MPISFATSLDLDLVYAKWTGFVDLPTFAENFGRYLSDRNYLPGRTEFVDLSELTDMDISFDIARGMLRRINTQLPGIVVETRIVVWAPDDTAYGVTRMFQQLAELSQGVQIEVYRSADEALSALDLGFDNIEGLIAAGAFVGPEPAKPSLARPS